MAAEGWAVRGVDSSEVAVAEACAQGLDVELGDLVEALEACPENALAGVTAFQVVEHLPFSRITALMHAAFRALVPGGYYCRDAQSRELAGRYLRFLDGPHTSPSDPTAFDHGSLVSRWLSRWQHSSQNPWPQWQETKVDSSLESEVGYRLFGPQDTRWWCTNLRRLINCDESRFTHHLLAERSGEYDAA